MSGLLRLLIPWLLLLNVPALAAPENLLFEVLSEKESMVTFGRGSRAHLNPYSIQALIWNIKKGSMEKFEEEFVRYSRGKELFLLQEVYRDDAFVSLIRKIRADWNFGISFLYKRENNTPTGSMVGGIFKATDSFVKHSPDKEPITDTPKSITFSRYPVRGRSQDLMVVSVHGINFETTGAFKRQMDQVHGELKNFTGPVLLAGDFNTWNKSRTSYLFEIISDLGLSEVRLKNGKYRKTFNGYYLDHIFARGVDIKSAEVRPESKGSDHQPMILDFRITSP